MKPENLFTFSDMLHQFSCPTGDVYISPDFEAAEGESSLWRIRFESESSCLQTFVDLDNSKTLFTIQARTETGPGTLYPTLGTEDRILRLDTKLETMSVGYLSKNGKVAFILKGTPGIFFRIGRLQLNYGHRLRPYARTVESALVGDGPIRVPIVPTSGT